MWKGEKTKREQGSLKSLNGDKYIAFWQWVWVSQKCMFLKGKGRGHLSHIWKRIYELSHIYGNVEACYLHPGCVSTCNPKWGDLGSVWRHGLAVLRTGRLGAHDGRARSKQRVAAGASPKGEASVALQRRGTACQAGNGAAITPLSRRWRDHVAPAPLPTILSALLTAHRSLPSTFSGGV